MRIVIQCAARKKSDAGYLLTKDKKKLCFVGNPEYAPKQPDCIYARPDDLADDEQTWREHLTAYNDTKDNPLGLLPAYLLRMSMRNWLIHVANSSTVPQIMDISAKWKRCIIWY
jgi:hypothetical protein